MAPALLFAEKWTVARASGVLANQFFEARAHGYKFEVVAVETWATEELNGRAPGIFAGNASTVIFAEMFCLPKVTLYLVDWCFY